MKSIKILKYFLFFSILFSVFIPNDLNGQPSLAATGSSINHEQPIEGGWAIVNCNKTYIISVELTNLDLFDPPALDLLDPESGEKVSTEFLPDGYPKMYLQVIADNETIILPVNKFRRVDYISDHQITVYSSFVEFSLDFCDNCSEEDVNTMDFPVHLKIVKENVDENGNSDGVGYVPYNACNYTGLYDIYSYGYNPNPYSTNSGPILNCDNQALTEVFFTTTAICEDHFWGSIPTADLDRIGRRIPVTPNPISDKFEIKIPEKVEGGTLTMTYSDGTIIKTLKNVKGSAILRIDSSNFRDGTYTIRIMDKKNQYFSRVAKF